MSTLDLSIFRREPTEQDIVAVTNEIRRHEATVTALQDRIQSLLADIQNLRKERDKHQRNIDRCKGVLTLARRIPQEVLAKIFERCIEDGWTRAPIIVSQVCSSWRRAARDPRVWSYIYINCDDVDVYNRTRFWLSMALHAPLYITIMASRRASIAQTTMVTDLVLQRVSQWRTFEINTGTSALASAILSRFNCTAPALCEVSVMTLLDVDPTEDDVDISDIFEVFTPATAPKLTTMRFYCNVMSRGLVFPAHIQDLTLRIEESSLMHTLSASSIMNVLESLHALQVFTLSMPLTYESEYIPSADVGRTVSLSALRSLTLYGPTNLNNLLFHLNAPNLQSLYLRSLEDVGYRQEPIGPSLVQFLHNCTPPLALLELHDIDLSPEHFAACFAVLPHLEELRLHESSLSDATVRSLYGSDSMCPRLKRMDLRWCGHLSGKALVGLVRSRNVIDMTHHTAYKTNANEAIAEITAINCCFIEEQDILDIARMAICRVMMRDVDDYCRPRGCCGNMRYRQRLYLRHMTNLSARDRASIRLIV